MRNMLTLRTIERERRIEINYAFGRLSFLPSSFAEMKPFEDAFGMVARSARHENIPVRAEVMALHACLFPAIITHGGRIRELMPHVSEAKMVAEKRGLDSEVLSMLREDTIVSREDGLRIALRMFRLYD